MGEVYTSVNVTVVRRKAFFFSFFFYFDLESISTISFILVFENDHLNICIRHAESRNMCIKSSYVEILCLVSYMLKLFFQKNNMNICKSRRK